MIKHILGSDISGLGRIWSFDQLAAGVLASATDLENQGTATNTSLLMSPGMMRHHPGMPKAWAKFTITGGVSAAFNVSTATGVTRNGTGNYTVRVTNHFSSATNWGCVQVLLADSGVMDLIPYVETMASTGVTVHARSAGGGGDSETNLTHVHVVMFGDQ